MSNQSPNSNNKTVSDFDSATQISRQDQLEMRILLVVDDQKRKVFTDKFFELKEHDVQRDKQLLNAESAYIERNLKLEHDLSLSLGSGERSYEQQVRDLRRSFEGSGEANNIRRDAFKQFDVACKSLNTDVEKTLADEKERGVTRDPIIKTHERIASPAFKRAVTRER